MSSGEMPACPRPVLAFGAFELHRDGRVVDHSGRLAVPVARRSAEVLRGAPLRSRPLLVLQRR